MTKMRGKRERELEQKGNSHFDFEVSKMRPLKSKRSQVTVFIILTLAIIAILAFVFYPNIKKAIIPQKPGDLIPKDCIEKIVRDNLNKTLLHGGNIYPELYFNYNNQSLTYICYTSEWYKTCVMQEPFLNQKVEFEVKKYSQTEIDRCVNSMIEKLKSKGYSVSAKGTKEATIEIKAPKKVETSLDIELTTEKNGEVEIIPKNLFQTNFVSNAYEMLIVASSIQNFEARYGDSDIMEYMIFYPNLKVQKLKQSDGTKVYIIEDRQTGEKLQFATRSLAWPPGFDVPAQQNTGVVA